MKKNQVVTNNEVMESILGAMVVVAIILAFRHPILIGVMNIVDFIGNTFNLTTIRIIDFLNTLYYL